MTEPAMITRDVCRTGRDGRQRAVLIGFGVGGVLLALALLAAGVGWWTPWTMGRYVQGVDVSWHQGPIDWRTLRKDDIRFAYIKATEGGDHVDPRFATNWYEAGNAGLYRGAYHFFTLCRPGAQQAANFINTVPRQTVMLPPAVDLEHMGPCRRGPTATDVAFEINEFPAHRRGSLRRASNPLHDARISRRAPGRLPSEQFWIRSLYTPPAFRQNDWVIWQHHNMARKPGVSQPIDLNAFRGDEEALARFARDNPELSRLRTECGFPELDASCSERASHE